jgi:catechol 2,3-dioxygenase-like lactoylglutathione lyase family enzyme
MRHIDHIVVAVRELDQAADFYCRLGFQVGARNQHPWGTENRLIQFHSSFIELITTGSAARQIASHQQRQFSFGAFVRDYLAGREGIAMLVLSSADAESDAAQFAKYGIGDFEPFSFARKARKPDGSETQVAFTLAFACDSAAPHAGFFVCQQHYPENFWNRSFQQHANSATNIAAVTLSAADPNRHAEFLTRFSGAEKQSQPAGGLRFALDGSLIEVVSVTQAQTQSLPPPLLTSFSVQVEEIDTLLRLLRAEGIPFTTSDKGIILAPAALFGVELHFETRTRM